LPEEKKAFLPYLQAQLEVIQPKIIVTLGRHSTNCFLPDLQISKSHGQPKRIRLAYSHSPVGGNGSSAMQGAGEARTAPYKQYGEGALEPVTPQRAEKPSSVSGPAGKQDGLPIVILPLYHPAAALYNGGMRQTLLDDFAAIPQILSKI
ncbi:MAG TPA: uracil-DNA glycosylase family protein, partial [Candidatus Saccharimonadales bacterium]|nr:uracil-DNA glycosylase family protein [Candidatus Saccharimonadales bacterium]